MPFLPEINELIDYRPRANHLHVLLPLRFLDQWTFVVAGGRFPRQSNIGLHYCLFNILSDPEPDIRMIGDE